MRNIRVANRDEWVFEPTKPIPQKPRRGFRDWLATGSMLLLIPALILPVVVASAGGASLTISPGTASRGDRLAVHGAGFPAGAAKLIWDGNPRLSAGFTVKASGSFALAIFVPTNMANGAHQVSVVSAAPTALADGGPASPVTRVVSKSTTVPSGRAAAVTSAAAATSVAASATVTIVDRPAVPAPTPAATPVTPAATPAAPPVATPVATPLATPVATPLATPVATPVATPRPTPAPTPAPAPAGGNPFAVAFATRPASGPVRLSNCSNVVIENKTFRNLGAGVAAIRIENCSNVTIRSVDFLNVAEGVYALNSSNITVVNSRYSNITGPAQPRTGANVANFVQFNNVARGLIGHNKGKGGDTEDIVSTYASDHITVQDNAFEGTNWTSGSGSGIALSDGGGSFNVAQRNILINPGQVGIFIAGGTNSKILDNTIYGAQRAKSNVGLYVWNQSSSTCSGNEVSRNRVSWRNAGGSANPSWNAGNCGTVAGWSTNVWNAALDLTTLHVGL